MKMLVGHVPVNGECKACGFRADLFPHEPCPEQKLAEALMGAGYLSLPASAQEFDDLVRLATGG